MKYKVVDREVQATGKWPTKVNDAIRESVKKWEFIARWHKRNTMQGTLIANVSSCALCQLFVEKTGSCNGCPVMKVTGQQQCRETPYMTYTHSIGNHDAHAMCEAVFLRGLLK